MKLIDEKGRLFGRVNAIDAAVVVGFLIFVVAGATVVFSSSPEPSQPDTTVRYVTLDLGNQPEYLATSINEGDTDTQSPMSNITIVDVYSSESDSTRHVWVRARVNALQRGATPVYADSPLHIGRSLIFATPEYQVNGTITSVDSSDPNLAVSKTDVVVRTTLPDETVQKVEKGQEYELDGRTIGTIQSIEAYYNNQSRTTAFIGITYRTYRSGNEHLFGNTAVREGASLPFKTANYTFSGRVVRQNEINRLGRVTTRTVTLELENIDPDRASGLRSGLQERVRDTTVAAIIDVEINSSTVVLTSQDGDIFERTHPTKKDVQLVAELRVRETDSGILFKGSKLHNGDVIFLNLGTITVRATVTGL
jgi:hypothetical protein